ncbi:uncharacterized protein LOC108600439 isoform X2 [Drosophila busckii]|uniref:uncharacterized protein LOC108600439 isoform X2 n=1 Tax=Drosophila busckii TaxID=30019 RepID=UPI00083E9CB2|nr:uncharacterized protein LOC108600439 isoform X2 [Drosophila busckii]
MIFNASKSALLRTGRITSAVQYMNSFSAIQPFHTSAVSQAAPAPAPALPLPNNVDAAETTRFSPQRSRDISDNIMAMSFAPISMIDITTDNSLTASQEMQARSSSLQDPHVQSYDCFGAVSLNAVMQSNVPTPFGGMHKFSHLNMPGGQWSQEYKFTSQNMQASHYRALRESTRADWVSYDQNAIIAGGKGQQGALHATYIRTIRIQQALDVITAHKLMLAHQLKLLMRPRSRNSNRRQQQQLPKS